MKVSIIFAILCGSAVSATQGASQPDFPAVRLSSLTHETTTTALTNGPATFPHEFRAIDGTGNNLIDPTLGAANTPLLRKTTVAYGDGMGTPAGAGEPDARAISNDMCAQDGSLLNTHRASDFLWAWGQFVDHDIDLTPTSSPAERFDILIPAGDPWFDPDDTGTQIMECDRSIYDVVDGVRQQINAITSFLDGSQVYASDTARAMELRTLDGTGRLKSSPGDLLPYNVDGFPNAPDNSPGYFLAGDVRANEETALTSMQTLFMREHNYWAGYIKSHHPKLDDDGIYYRARAIVGAEIQVITYRDFLPALLGPNALPPYRGYQPNVDPRVGTTFSTAAFRVGHTMLSPQIRRLDANNQSIGDLPLADAFFDPTQISGFGIDVYMRGLAKQTHQEIDCYLVDGVRNFLFGPPGAGGFDLASLNIQRGRDHGLPRYNVVRENYGLAPKTSFAQITSDPVAQAKLAAIYATPNDIDVWIGALAEDHVNGGLVGELISTILKDQFTRTRDGDRFWYQSYLPPNLVRRLENQPLSAIIRRNTNVGRELQNNVFLVPPGY
ncbi:MAG: peroxidase family protein [Chthoniobacterales bacterium]